MSRVVMNADIIRLQRVRAVMQEVERLESRMQWERERMQHITQSINGMPGRKGGVPSGLDEVFAELSELEERHKNQLKRYTIEMNRAERIIGAIESVNMKAFVTMMYLENQKYEDVRTKLNMSRRGFENARNAVEGAKSMENVKWHDRFICGNSAQ